MSGQERHPIEGDLYWREACKTEALETTVAELRNRCAALEAEVARLREMVVGNEMLIKTHQTMVRELRADRDIALALPGELAAAAKALSVAWDDDPKNVFARVEALRSVLRRAEAEAGGEKQG